MLSWSDEELWREVDAAYDSFWYHPKHEMAVCELRANKPEKLTKRQKNLLISFSLITGMQRDLFISQLTDGKLMEVSRRILRSPYFNRKFEHIAFQILKSNPSMLTPKQKNTFYGLLTVDWDTVLEKQNVLRA
jgi:hypothetical protein